MDDWIEPTFGGATAVSKGRSKAHSEREYLAARSKRSTSAINGRAAWLYYWACTALAAIVGFGAVVIGVGLLVTGQGVGGDLLVVLGLNAGGAVLLYLNGRLIRWIYALV